MSVYLVAVDFSVTVVNKRCWSFCSSLWNIQLTLAAQILLQNNAPSCKSWSPYLAMCLTKDVCLYVLLLCPDSLQKCLLLAFELQRIAYHNRKKGENIKLALFLHLPTKNHAHLKCKALHPAPATYMHANIGVRGGGRGRGGRPSGFKKFQGKLRFQGKR